LEKTSLAEVPGPEVAGAAAVWVERLSRTTRMRSACCVPYIDNDGTRDVPRKWGQYRHNPLSDDRPDAGSGVRPLWAERELLWRLEFPKP
jgi:hypothetical protein